MFNETEVFALGTLGLGLGLLGCARLAKRGAIRQRRPRILHRLREEAAYRLFAGYGALCVRLYRWGAPTWLFNLPKCLAPRLLRRAGAEVYLERHYISQRAKEATLSTPHLAAQTKKACISASP